MRQGRHIPLLLVFLLLLVACGGRKGRVIPEKKMAALYADMFLSDQWLKENKEARASADTTLFFDPVFEKYGYTFADYEKSIEYYSAEPEVLSRIIDSASASLKRQSDRYNKISMAIRKANEANEKNRVDYASVDFSKDSAVWAAVEILWPLKDSLALRVDSLEAGASVLAGPRLENPKAGRPLRDKPEEVLVERVGIKELEF